MTVLFALALSFAAHASDAPIELVDQDGASIATFQSVCCVMYDILHEGELQEFAVVDGGGDIMFDIIHEGETVESFAPTGGDIMYDILHEGEPVESFAVTFDDGSVRITADLDGSYAPTEADIPITLTFDVGE